MPLGKLREDYVPLPASRTDAMLSAEAAGFAATPSPVRALQQQIELRAIGQAAPRIEKWSPRHAIVFIVAASAAMWMTLIVAGAQIARAVA